MDWLLSLGAIVIIKDGAVEKKITAGIKIPTGRITIIQIAPLNSEQTWDITDEDLGRFKGLNDLLRIYFAKCPNVTGAGLALFGSLPSLKLLHLNFPNADAACLAKLPDFPMLNELSLVFPFTAEQFSSLPPLKSLLSLVGGNNVTDANLATIVKRTKLTSLALGYCQISDDGLARLKGMKDLESLYFDGGSTHSITGAGLVHLAELPHLFRLGIGSRSFDTKNVARLSELKYLTELIVSGDNLKDTNEWIRQLSDLNGRITKITLHAKSGFTATQAATLKQALPKVGVVLD